MNTEVAVLCGRWTRCDKCHLCVNGNISDSAAASLSSASGAGKGLLTFPATSSLNKSSWL